MNKTKEPIYVIKTADRRYEHLAHLIYEDGEAVYTWGEGEADGLYAVSSLFSLNRPIRLILPFVQKPDDALYAVKSCPENSEIFAGNPFLSLNFILREKHIIWNNILSDKKFAKDNAVLTAEGTLCEVTANTEKAICKQNILILGWGITAKATAKLFSLAGADITIAARRNEARLDAASHGLRVIDFPIEDIDGYDTVINTVPSKNIIPIETLESTHSNPLIADIASGNENISARTCEEIGIKLKNLPNLPGRFSPVSAAENIRNAIYRLNERPEYE